MGLYGIPACVVRSFALNHEKKSKTARFFHGVGAVVDDAAHAAVGEPGRVAGAVAVEVGALGGVAVFDRVGVAVVELRPAGHPRRAHVPVLEVVSARRVLGDGVGADGGKAEVEGAAARAKEAVPRVGATLVLGTAAQVDRLVPAQIVHLLHQWQHAAHRGVVHEGLEAVRRQVEEDAVPLRIHLADDGRVGLVVRLQQRGERTVEAVERHVPLGRLAKRKILHAVAVEVFPRVGLRHGD